MAIITALLSIALAYLGFNLVCGIMLCVYYFGKEEKITDSNEFLNLLFFPATGLGRWIYNRKIRAGLPKRYTKTWYVYQNMVRVHWVFILFILAYESMLFGRIYIMLQRWQQLKAVGKEITGQDASGIAYRLLFEWMADMGLYITAFASVITLLFSFVFCFLALIMIPKWKMKGPRQLLQHTR